MDTQCKKILVALSGGVDSAVAAALLKKQGHEVVGVYFLLGDWGNKGLIGAKKIAEKLGIPLKIVDARKEFKKRVIDYFLGAYKIGLTPNPCVVCNKEMKFQLLFDLMKKYNADAVATGHYARIHATRNTQHITQKKELRVMNYVLREASDKTKDQSYFLYRLTQKDLTKIIFPLGNYKKTEVKKIAKKLRLPVAENESQDICFVSGNDITVYLKKNIKIKSGDVVADVCRKKKVCRFHHVDKLTQYSFYRNKKNAIGKHKGLPFYTIGQRKGIEIGPPASRQEREVLRASGTRPYYVVKKNLKKNELIVTNNPKKLLTKKFRVSGVDWANKGIKLPLQAKVQIRYRAPKIGAIIKKAKKDVYEVKCEKYLRAVTAGQSAVFYKNGEILGGGVII